MHVIISVNFLLKQFEHSFTFNLILKLIKYYYGRKNNRYPFF